jgi:hypothetical protein
MNEIVKAAVDRMRKHREVIGNRDLSAVFGYEVGYSPYYDHEWGHVDQTRLEEDIEIILDDYFTRMFPGKVG